MKHRRFILLLVLSIAAIGRTAAAPLSPTPSAPADGASVTVPFTISWSAVLEPNQVNGGYNWQVSPSSSFSPLILADSTNPATTEDTISGLANGTYFWRVQAVDGTGQSAWSQPRSFTVTGAGPGTPGTPVLAPTRGYPTFHPWEAIHFDWSAVPDAVTYRLEVSNDPSFPLGTVPPGTVTFWNDNIPTNSDGYVHTMQGNWFARVFAVSADNPQEGVRSRPSNVIQFSCFFNNPIGPPPELISPLGNPTLTLPVTLTWAHVPNPQPMGYILEVAKDSAFSNVEWAFNQYTEPSTVMLSLTSGPKFWRVRSQHGLSSPTTNAVTAPSTTGTFTISSAPPTPVSIAPLGNPQMFMYSGASGWVALQLTAGVPASGATVALSSSHPTLAPVPSSLSMPGTHAYAEFPITVGQVTSPTIVTLTATLNGVTASNQFTVRPPTLNDDILQPVVRATGGATMTGWVDLEGGGLAGPGGFGVNLSANSALVTIPATVTIPAGVNSTSFSIQTSAVTTATTVTITASSGGVTTQWPIILSPAPAPTSLLVRPMSTTSGSQGTVTAAEGVGVDQLLKVTSSNPSLAAVPDTVTVFAGSGIGFFDITTATVTSPTSVTISVTGSGVTLSRPLTLYPSLPALSALTVSPATVVGGNPSTGTVALAGPAPAVGVAVNLGSNQPLTASVPLSVTVPASATTASFPVTTFAGSGTTTVQLSAALDSVFQFAAITVTPPAQGPTLSAISVNPTTVVGGSSSTGTVTLTAAAPSGGAVVSLSDDSAAVTVPASVTVLAGATTANFTVTTSSVTTSTSATIAGSSGGVSRTVTLTVNPPPPSAPSLLSPADQATVAQPITFDWTDAANAATYEIQIDNASNFTAPLTLSQTVSVSQATIGGLPAQQLWWRVRGRNSAGVTGPFSASRRFTAQAAPSTASLSAVSVNPTSVVGGNTAQGTVTLTSAAPAGGAVVALSSSSSSASVPASVTVAAGATTATFTVNTVTVAANTSATLTATHNAVNRTATLTITAVPTGPLPAPSLISPAVDARFSPGQNIVFDWSDVTGAASYTIQIDDAETFPAPQIVNQTVTASTFSSSTLPTLRMWWRVRANDSAGNPGNWSAVRRFEVRN